MYMIWISDVEIATLWPSEEARVVLNSIAFSWSIDYTHHLVEMELKELYTTISTTLQGIEVRTVRPTL